ncbi:hypothetical protein PAALTS15_13972 [Paenibacillus alvei TS-15]|jgi:hypothetical protein|uniref:Uncharacterized protein n=1 Tax=Paenibacillus alvei TS-15 TaxID=1117108 RepID=S9TWX0_PAEAL|nr:hypothetical protein [Paenibacillus alvei]EPY06716.1 hypothetical protein PAALTS15_13972 [Paenibacillus alvei TS-15]
MVNDWFEFDERLGIEVPLVEDCWDGLSWDEQVLIMDKWEHTRGRIPDRIKELERTIVLKQDALNEEEQFEASCRLNSEIAELASQIIDLNLWYRVQSDVDAKNHH